MIEEDPGAPIPKNEELVKKRHPQHRRRRPNTPQSTVSFDSCDENNSSSHQLHHGGSYGIHRATPGNSGHGHIMSLGSHEEERPPYHRHFRNENHHHNNNNIYNAKPKTGGGIMNIKNWIKRSSPVKQPQQIVSYTLNQKRRKKSAPRSRDRVLKITVFSIFLYILSFVYLFPVLDKRTDDEPTNHTNLNSRTSEWKSRNLDEAFTIGHTRKTNRRDKTHPPPYTSSIETLSSHPYHSFHLDTTSDLPPLKDSDSLPAMASDLCGIYARKTSEQMPSSFPRKHTLTRKSIVLITGILNPLGFHLAVALQEQCGVSKIIGMDAMLPNTIMFRLDSLRKISILTKDIPELHQPLYTSFVGIIPKGKSNPKELDIVSKYHPTHIIHLGSMEGSYDSAIPVATSGSGKSYGSGRPLLELRQTPISMEQILNSIKESDEKKRPHLTYASSTGKGEGNTFGSTKLMDEVIANAYRNLYGVNSVGVRLGTVYGPWGKRGSQIYDAMEHLVRNGFVNETEIKLDQDTKEWIYVKDAVDFLIGSMQFHPTQRGTIALSSGGEKHSVKQLIDLATELLKDDTIHPKIPDTYDDDRIRARINPTNWYPSVSLQNGLINTIAWHLDNTLPFGPSSTHSEKHTDKSHSYSPETGYHFRNRKNQTHCDGDDFFCRHGMPVFPCVSECVPDHDSCTPSLFDDVLSVSQKITHDCNILLYTSFLDLKDNEQLPLNSTSQIDESSHHSKKVCNIAFISKSHLVVSSLVNKTIAAQENQEEGKLNYDSLNGKLEEMGWTLVWMDYEENKLSHMDRNVLKLSPSKFFSSNVRHAMFVDSTYSACPKADDVLFLSRLMHRSALKERKVTITKPDETKLKVTMPEETEKRAVFLAPAAKLPKPTHGKKKASISQMTEVFQSDNDSGSDTKSEQTHSLIQQRDFYDRVHSYVDKDDFRPIIEPEYKFDMKHWIRSKWVLHDLREEEGRDLRCEWYQEHSHWKNELDQLSFGYVMARREVERRFARHEMDDRMIDEMPQEEEWVKHVLDKDDWTQLIASKGGIKPFVRTIIDEGAPSSKDLDSVDLAKDQSGVDLFVRIVSENIMISERKEWVSKKKK